MLLARPQAYAPPIFRTLMAFAASALVGGLVTDLAYTYTTDFVWADASDWLVSIAAVFGFLALVAALIEVLSKRAPAPPLIFSLAALVAWLLSIADTLIHTRDSWTSVVPWGVTLSALAVIALVVAVWASRRTPFPPAVEANA